MIYIITGFLLGSVLLTLYNDALPHVQNWIINGN